MLNCKYPWLCSQELLGHPPCWLLEEDPDLVCLGPFALAVPACLGLGRFALVLVRQVRPGRFALVGRAQSISEQAGREAIDVEQGTTFC